MSLTTVDWNTAGGDWFDANNWVSFPSDSHEVPNSNDIANIALLNAGEPPYIVTYDGNDTVSDLIGNPAAATLDITGGLLELLDGNSDIVGYTSPNIDVGNGAALTIDADTFTVPNGNFSGAVGGEGTIEFNPAGTFNIDAGAARPRGYE